MHSQHATHLRLLITKPPPPQGYVLSTRPRVPEPTEWVWSLVLYTVHSIAIYQSSIHLSIYLSIYGRVLFMPPAYTVYPPFPPSLLSIASDTGDIA